MTSISFSAEDASISWKGIQKDVRKLSRNSFYQKYQTQLEKAGVTAQAQGQLYPVANVVGDLNKVEELFYTKGYSQWKEIKSMKDEFQALYESSAGAYAVLKRRVYDINLKTYKDQTIAKTLRDQVNDKLSTLSKNIDKHFRAKSNIPSRAHMVAALGSISGQFGKTIKNEETSGVLSSLNLSSKDLILAVGAFGLLGLLLFSLNRRRRNKARREEEQNEMDSILGEGLSRTGVITVNGRGQVDSMNLRASALFKGAITQGDIWDDFFQKNFYRGKKHLGVKGFYRFAPNSKVIFYINGNMDKVSQMRTIEVAQMSLKDFDNALTLLERSSIRVDSMELIDSVFSELINLNKVSLSLDVFNLMHFGKGSDYLYLSEFEGKKYISHVLKMIDTFTQFKTNAELSRIDIDRDGSDFLVRVNIANCQVSEADLNEVIVFDQKTIKFNDVFKSFQDLSHSYNSSLIVKNLTIKGERRVELKFKIQDNSTVQTVHRSRTVGRERNA